MTLIIILTYERVTDNHLRSTFYWVNISWIRDTRRMIDRLTTECSPEKRASYSVRSESLWYRLELMAAFKRIRKVYPCLWYSE